MFQESGSKFKKKIRRKRKIPEDYKKKKSHARKKERDGKQKFKAT